MHSIATEQLIYGPCKFYQNSLALPTPSELGEMQTLEAYKVLPYNIIVDACVYHQHALTGQSFCNRNDVRSLYMFEQMFILSVLEQLDL